MTAAPFIKYLTSLKKAVPSMERTVRPFVPVVSSLAQDSTPVPVAPAQLPASLTWGGAPTFNAANFFEESAVDPPERRYSGPPETGADAKDIEFVFNTALPNFYADGGIRRLVIQGPDLAAGRRIVERTPFGHRPARPPQVRWQFDYPAVE